MLRYVRNKGTLAFDHFLNLSVYKEIYDIFSHFRRLNSLSGLAAVIFAMNWWRPGTNLESVATCVASTLRHWLAVIANKNWRFRSVTKVHPTRTLCKAEESHPLSHARVALATTDKQSILEIPATDDIHTEDRNYALPWTKPNNGIYNTRKQLHISRAKLWRSQFSILFYLLTDRSPAWPVDHHWDENRTGVNDMPLQLEFAWLQI